MKRLILLAALATLAMPDSFAQTVRELPPAAYELYPTLREMYGYAVGAYHNYLIVFGGSIRSDVPELYKGDFPNLDILLIDLARKRASAYTSSNLEGTLAEQASSTGMAYYQQGNTLYLLGGYGYSESNGHYITFPYLAVIELDSAIESLIAGRTFQSDCYQLCDDRLAVFGSLMDSNQDEFFLLNGKFAYKLQPFSDHAQYFEDTMEGQARTFRLKGKGQSLQLGEFQTWYDLEGFRDHYGPLLPEAIEKAVQQQIKELEQ